MNKIFSRLTAHGRSRSSVIASSSHRRPYYLLILPCAAFGLGVWQIERRKWKMKMIAHIGDHASQDPSLFNEKMLIEDSVAEYTPIKLRGMFDHDKEIYLGPRTIIEDNVPHGESFYRGSSVGYNILTPLKLLNADESVIINRGWVPLERLHPGSRKATQVDGVVEVVGLFRKTEKRAPMQRRTYMSIIRDKRRTDSHPYNVLNRKDIAVLSELMGTSHFLVDARYDPAIARRGGPVGGQTRGNVRNEHMQYVITWFSLGIVTTLLWFYRYK